MDTSDKRILKLLVVQTQNKTIPVLTVAIHSLQEPTSRKVRGNEWEESC